MQVTDTQSVVFPVEPTVANCGHTVQPKGIGTGIAYDSNDYTRCYDCAHAEELEYLRTAQNYFAYLSMDCRTVVDWPGKPLGTVLAAWDAAERWSAYGRSRRTYVHMRDAYGALWYGSGPAESGAFVRLHRAKRGGKLDRQYN